MKDRPTGRPSDGIRRASWLPAVSLARSACSATTCSMTRRMRAGSSIPTIFSAPSTDCTLAISASSSSAVWGSGSAAGTPRCAATRHRREQNCLVHRNAADRLPHWRHAKGRPRRPPRRSSTGRPARLALDRSAASRLASARHSSEQSLARRMKRRPGQAAARLPWSARYRRLEIELDPFRGTTVRRCNLACPCPSRIKPLLAGKIHFDPRETHASRVTFERPVAGASAAVSFPPMPNSAICESRALSRATVRRPQEIRPQPRPQCPASR
jgi:hypothetical protein